MTNVTVQVDGDEARGILQDGHVFLFDSCMMEVVTGQKWYFCLNKSCGRGYICNKTGKPLHYYLLDRPVGYEIDHINMDTLDNRLRNLRVVTHQQNQINQGLQKNNASGVAGVSFYPPRKKYRARVKIGQHDIHLGYYLTFLEAVQARNVGMECMFGEYGQYNDAPLAPKWIRRKVMTQCKRFAELSICRAFLSSLEEETSA